MFVLIHVPTLHQTASYDAILVSRYLCLSTPGIMGTKCISIMWYDINIVSSMPSLYRTIVRELYILSIYHLWNFFVSIALSLRIYSQSQTLWSRVSRNALFCEHKSNLQTYQPLTTTVQSIKPRSYSSHVTYHWGECSNSFSTWNLNLYFNEAINDKNSTADGIGSTNL